MSTAQDFLNLDWLGPIRKGRYVTNADVSITECKDGRITFFFRNKCYKKMASNGAFSKLEFAIFNENVIVFRSSNEGFTLRGNNYNDTVSFRVTTSIKNGRVDCLKDLSTFVGDYELKYEDKFKLWYISKI